MRIEELTEGAKILKADGGMKGLAVSHSFWCLHESYKLVYII